MAGGPIFPHSAFPVTDSVFPNVHVGAGGNSRHDEGFGLSNATDLTADATWRFRFQTPPTLPTGTAKLRVLSLANATSGSIAWQINWVSVASEEDPSSASLNAEDPGNMTWGAGDADQYKEQKIALNADTIVASEEIVLDLVFENAVTDLAVVSTHIVSVI